MFSRKLWLSKEVFLAGAFLLFFVVPVVALGANKVLVVDKNAEGEQDGSYSHPYHSIAKALEHVKGSTEVRVKNGTYKEHFTLPEDVKLVSDSGKRDKVIIEGDNSKKATIVMKDNTYLSKVTIRGGQDGVRIAENAKVHIFDVIIKNSNRDGIHVYSAPRDKRHRALIDKVKITNSDRAGIFSEKRLISLINSDITNNGGDGADFAAGMEGWLEDNHFSENKGSGAKFVLDGSNIWSKSNDFRKNNREGIEVNAYGAGGTVGFQKAEIIGNHRFGIAKVARKANALNTLGGVAFGTGVNKNRIEQNSFGSISSVIRGF